MLQRFKFASKTLACIMYQHERDSMSIFLSNICSGEFGISHWGRCQPYQPHGGGALMSNAGAFQQKRMQKQKNWVPLGEGRGAPGSATDLFTFEFV